MNCDRVIKLALAAIRKRNRNHNINPVVADTKGRKNQKSTLDIDEVLSHSFSVLGLRRDNTQLINR
jgi:hypothetical protein